MLRLDIPEGARFDQMPAFVGYGRVLALRPERYFTLNLGIGRFFIAALRHDDGVLTFRWWFR